MEKVIKSDKFGDVSDVSPSWVFVFYSDEEFRISITFILKSNFLFDSNIAQINHFPSQYVFKETVVLLFILCPSFFL